MSLFLLSTGGCDSHLLAVVPVPFRYLMEGHPNLFCNFNFLCHWPLWTLIEVLYQHFHLAWFLTLTPAFFPLTEIFGLESQSCFHLVITHSILSSIVYNFSSGWILCLKVLLQVMLSLLLRHKVLWVSSLHCIEILFFLLLSKLLISPSLNTKRLPILHFTNRYTTQKALLAWCCSSERVPCVVVIGYANTLPGHHWLRLIHISSIMVFDTKGCCRR